MTSEIQTGHQEQKQLKVYAKGQQHVFKGQAFRPGRMV